jgi:nucleoside-diphosphate-sugar epimerase
MHRRQMITVLGGTGFIGSNLVAYLKKTGQECFTPDRDFDPATAPHLGHVINCIGLTADFRTRPMETVEAHVCRVVELLQKTRFDSFLYLSSTRVYNNAGEGAEAAGLSVNPNDFSDLYNLSKLMGESICLSVVNKNVRAARLSNVIGNDLGSENFIFSLIRDAVDKGRIVLGQPLDHAKDYIGIGDALRLLVDIATKGKQRLYNIASGNAISNRAIVDRISGITGCTVEAAGGNGALNFPAISIRRVVDEFGFRPENVLENLPGIINIYKQSKNDTH